MQNIRKALDRSRRERNSAGDAESTVGDSHARPGAEGASESPNPQRPRSEAPGPGDRGGHLSAAGDEMPSVPRREQMMRPPTDGIRPVFELPKVSTRAAQELPVEMPPDEGGSVFAGMGRFVLGGIAAGVFLAGAILVVRHLGNQFDASIPGLAHLVDAQVEADASEGDSRADLSGPLLTPIETDSEGTIPNVLSPLPQEVLEPLDQQVADKPAPSAGDATVAAMVAIEADRAADSSATGDVAAINVVEPPLDRAEGLIERAAEQVDTAASPGLVAQEAVDVFEEGGAALVEANVDVTSEDKPLRVAAVESTSDSVDQSSPLSVMPRTESEGAAADVPDSVESKVEERQGIAPANPTADRGVQPQPAQVAIREIDAAPPSSTTPDQSRARKPQVETSDEPSLATYTRHYAERQLLALWNLDYQPSGADFCSEMVRFSLQCLNAGGGLSALLQFNRPAILKVNVTGVPAYALARKLSSDRVLLDVLGRQHSIRAENLEQVWDGDFLLLWRRPEEVGRNIVIGTRGMAVQWLRNTIDQIEGTPSSVGNSYDQELAARVRRFQRNAGLNPDGIVGPLTLVMLQNRLVELKGATAPKS